MAIMEPRSIFEFAVRAAVMFLLWTLSLLPPAWDVHVDVPAILKAVTMSSGGVRVDAGVWPEAPTMQQFTDSPSYDAAQPGTRPGVFNAWKEYCDRQQTWFPHRYKKAMKKKTASNTGKGLGEARDELDGLSDTDAPGDLDNDDELGDTSVVHDTVKTANNVGKGKGRKKSKDDDSEEQESEDEEQQDNEDEEQQDDEDEEQQDDEEDGEEDQAEDRDSAEGKLAEEDEEANSYVQRLRKRKQRDSDGVSSSASIYFD